MDLKNKRIMIISPHLDDEVIGCGGLITTAAKEIINLFILYVCSGTNRQVKDNTVNGTTTHDVRIKELKKLSKKGKFEWKILFTEDKYFIRLDGLHQKDIIDPIEDKICEFEPDILFVPFKDSYNQDHRAVFRACITALRPIPQKLRHFVPMVLMYEEPYTWTVNNSFNPNIYLDISGFEEEKAELMKCYASQDRESPFARSGENLVRRAHIRGSEVGVKAAEAYVLLRGILKLWYYLMILVKTYYVYNYQRLIPARCYAAQTSPDAEGR